MIFRKKSKWDWDGKDSFFLSTPFVESNSLEVSVQKFDVLKKKCQNIYLMEKNSNTIFSLDWPITKNQKSAKVIFCHFNTKREEKGQSYWNSPFGVWYLVFSLQAYPMKRTKHDIVYASYTNKKFHFWIWFIQGRSFWLRSE